MNDNHHAPSLPPLPPKRPRVLPPVPPQVDVGKATVTVVLDDGERHVLSFEGERNGPDPFDSTSQWVTTAKEQVESWLAFSAKKGFMRLQANVYVLTSRVRQVVADYQPYLLSARRA